MNFNLKILVTIGDRRMEMITQNLANITSIRLGFISLN